MTTIIINITKWLYQSYLYLTNQNKKWYIIEGNIGSGKTELLNKLKENLDCEIIIEPVNVWQTIIGDNNKNILQHFYDNPKRYAYIFQAIVLQTRLQSIEIPQSKNIRFTERSIWTDKYIFGKVCIETNLMNELEKNAYLLSFNWLEKIFSKKPDGIIYLQCSPNKCLNRVNLRARNEETSISIDYLQTIHDNHESWLSSWTDTKKLIINNDNDNDWNNVIKQIKLFISPCYTTYTTNKTNNIITSCK